MCPIVNKPSVSAAMSAEQTFLQQLDPRSKLIFVFFMAIMTFLANNVASFVLLLLLGAVAVTLSALPGAALRRALRPVFWLAVFTLLLHLFGTRQGEVVFQWGWFAVYTEGVRKGILFALRLFLLFLFSALLSLTTPPLRLSAGIELLLSPLKRLRIPVAELALMMSMALRYIPLLTQEAEKIMKAQMARGADFSSRHLGHRVSSLFSLLIPLLIRLLYRAEELAVALEVKGYVRGLEKKTRYRQLRMGRKDGWTLGMLLPLLLGVLLLRS